MAVAVEGERDAAAPDDLLQQQEVAARVLDGAEEGVHGCAGRIVNGEQEGEARASLLEPGVVAAVDLEQHPLAGHPLTPDTVLGRPAPAGTRDAGPRQDPADGPTAHVQALVLPEQLGEVGVIRSRVAGGGEAHHGRGDVGRDGVVRTAPAVAVLQRRGSARTVGGEEPPRVSLADAQDLGGLRGPQISGHHPFEYVASCFFGLLHLSPPARWLGTDRIAAPLTTDRIAAQRHQHRSHCDPSHRLEADPLQPMDLPDRVPGASVQSGV